MHMMHRVTRIFFFKNLNLRLAETQVSEYMYYIYILQMSSNWSSHYCIVKIFLPNLFLQQSLMPNHTPSIITARDALKKKIDFEISLPWLLYIKSTQLNGNSFYICLNGIVILFLLLNLKKGKGTFPSKGLKGHLSTHSSYKDLSRNLT